ncbi:5-hydroxyisourate hydrolase [Paraoerskovia sediminicola]|uniref:5-hydroxyisourate hydrolase n=1 Tax=Paraoerskovia sediminicola TaxID=1138587 RepID=A0ABN6XIT9_9CELL|nr:hydroxyisourate hydrolase [Paraoerskovia sediminicola]BDZ43441.1 5-hydroxyisourate hydrolase [Paraoerskovia sediminicola]
MSSSTRPHVTAHVLDTAAGTPARGVAVRLEAQGPEQTIDGTTTETWRVVATSATNDDGRVTDLGPQSLDAGTYRLVFGTGDYFARTGTDTYFPFVSVAFVVTDDTHHHVPLLLSPFALSSYRGS